MSVQTELRANLYKVAGSKELLLLACARTQLTTDGRERVDQLAQQETDWDTVLDLAARHGVVPLLYRSLEAVCPAAVPPAIRAALREAVQVIVQGNLFLTRELVDVAARFRQSAIEFIPYKGPILTMSLYGDLSLRPFADLDILVHDTDVERSVHLLQSAGYKVIRPPALAGAKAEEQALLAGRLLRDAFWAYQVVAVHPGRGTVVELHWRVAPSYVLTRTQQSLWEELAPVTVAGTTLYSFAAENLLWFLCVHGAKHNWGRLNWICDVAELVRAHPDLNWEKVLTTGRELAVERRLSLGLLLANLVLDAPLPAAIQDRIDANKDVQMLAKQVVDRVFSPPGAGTQRLDQLPFQLRSMDRGADRARYLRHIARTFFSGLKPQKRAGDE